MARTRIGDGFIGRCTGTALFQTTPSGSGSIGNRSDSQRHSGRESWVLLVSGPWIGTASTSIGSL